MVSPELPEAFCIKRLRACPQGHFPSQTVDISDVPFSLPSFFPPLFPSPSLFPSLYRLLLAHLIDHKGISVIELLNRVFDPVRLEAEFLAPEGFDGSGILPPYRLHAAGKNKPGQPQAGILIHLFVLNEGARPSRPGFSPFSALNRFAVAPALCGDLLQREKLDERVMRLVARQCGQRLISRIGIDDKASCHRKAPGPAWPTIFSPVSSFTSL